MTFHPVPQKHNLLPYELTFEEKDVHSFLLSMPERSELCVVVPAYNEEQVISSSLKAMTDIISKDHIYVVSDGSTDRTVELARQHTDNVLELTQNMGKAAALDQLIQANNLITRYEYILFSDADSRLAPNFLEEIKKYTIHDPACIVGTVASDKHGLISAYRTYEYGLSHRVYKQAQSKMRVITVAPGSSSLYRSDVLRELDFSNHTLTEDFDLTLQIYEKNLGRVIYAPKAKVITQDPQSLGDYWKQVMRWYTGFWQNVLLHKIYKPNKAVNVEIWIIVADSLSWIVALVLGIQHPVFFGQVMLVSLIITEVLSFSILMLEKQYWALKYMPMFFLFQLINIATYILSFFRAFKFRNSNKALLWQKVSRYAVSSDVQ
jgi:cellulose synthase/poly-beta-1,6-N-acetylglucosamine synthase-like glycosyltransferase